MPHPGRVALLLLLSLTLNCAAAAEAAAPPWDSARAAILKHYDQEQPGSKVIEVSGPSREESPKHSVLRYFGAAVVEQPDGSRSEDQLLIEYHLVGESWRLDRVHIFESTALAEIAPPATGEAQKLLAAAWRPDLCEGFDILAVVITGEPDFQREIVADPAAAKRWYVYPIEVSARGTGKSGMSEAGVSYVNATKNMLLWNPAGKSWSVEPRHVRCTGFGKRS